MTTNFLRQKRGCLGFVFASIVFIGGLMLHSESLAESPSPGIVWTDPVITPDLTVIRAQHIIDLRNNLSAKLSACGVTVPRWTDADLIPNRSVIKKVHLDELRAGVRQLASAASPRTMDSTGLPFTDPTIVAGTTTIKAAHITELRNYISTYTCIPTPTWASCTPGYYFITDSSHTTGICSASDMEGCDWGTSTELHVLVPASTAQLVTVTNSSCETPVRRVTPMHWDGTAWVSSGPTVETGGVSRVCMDAC